MKKENDNGSNFTYGNTVKSANEKVTMKKSFARRDLLFASISFVILLVAGIVIYVMYTSWNRKHLSLMEMQKNSFTEQITERDSAINEWILTFDQIEKDLNVIKEKEQIITNKSSDVEFTADKKKQILDDIRFINSLLEENKQKIAALNKQLQKSGGTIKSMQNKLAQLEESVIQREKEIAVLKTELADKDFEIGQLNSHMSELQNIVAQQDTKITDQSAEIISKEEELNTAFVAYGSFRDLKEKGLVSKEGGFLGIGRKGTINQDFADSLFTRINISETRIIPVHSKNVKLITKHPVDSYELTPEENGDQIAYIEIKDPGQFWKISKYAVVEVNK